MNLFEFKSYEDNDGKESKRYDTVTYSDSVEAFTLSDELQYIDETVLDDYLRKLSKSKLNGIDTFDAIRTQEDVKPGLIEGGFTLWDGSKDLVNYISEHFLEKIYDKHVLELGCGCGLPGILALKTGARLIRFQDYNSEVLKWWTIPNAIINLEFKDFAVSHKKNSQLEFFSGDWFRLSEVWQLTTNIKFDYIFTSETIYRPDLYERLHKILETSVCQTGVVLLACKASYGSGGNMFDWVNYVQNLGVFQTTISKITTTGAIRYIIKMSRT